MRKKKQVEILNLRTKKFTVKDINQLKKNEEKTKIIVLKDVEFEKCLFSQLMLPDINAKLLSGSITKYLKK